MPIEIKCGQCGKRYRLGDQLAGKKVKCKACAAVMTVPMGDAAEEDLGPIAMGDRISAPRRTVTPAVENDPEADSFESIAARAFEDDGDSGGEPTPAVQPFKTARAAKKSPRGPSRNIAMPAYLGRGVGIALFAVAMLILRFQGYRPLQDARSLASTEFIGISLLLAGGIVFLFALAVGALTAIREPDADWNSVRTPAIRGGIGVGLLIVGVVLLQHPHSLLPTPKPVEMAKSVSKGDQSGKINDASSETPAVENPVAVAGKSDSTMVPPQTAANTKVGANVRLTADGKPIPPPPFDPASDDAILNGDVKMNSAGRGRSTAIPSIAKNFEPTGLGGFEEIRAPLTAGPWIFTRRPGAGGELWVRYNTAGAPDTWKPTGRVQLADNWSAMIFSPNGDYLVRQGNVGGVTVEVWSLSDGQLARSINGKGMSGLIGFVSEDQFVVPSAGNGVLAVVSAKTGLRVWDIKLPANMSFSGPECSTSLEGSMVAIPVRADPAPLLLLYNAAGPRRIALPGFEKDKFRFSVSPESSAFSKDGKKVAVVLQSQRASILYICGVAEGRVLASFEYPDLRFSMRNFGDNVQPLQWLGNSDCVLFHNQVVIDSATGRVVGFTDKAVSFLHEIGAGKLLLKHGTTVTGQSLEVCEIDNAVLEKQRDAAKSAGPMRFDWPELNASKFASLAVPRAGVTKPGAAPDPAPSIAPVSELPIAIDGAYSHVREVLFSRVGTGVAVVAIAPDGSEKGEWDPLSSADFKLQRLDLAMGKSTPALRLPILSKLLAISPDAGMAVMASDAGDRAFHKPMARLDVVSTLTGKPAASFAPYLDAVVVAAPGPGRSAVSPAVVAGEVAQPSAIEKVAMQTIAWAAMTDNDSVITLSGGHLLVRWSVSTRRAMWMRANVVGPLVVSPGGNQIVGREGNLLLVIDVKTGDSIGSLAPEALAGAEVKSADFSEDGTFYFGATTNGLFRWDVATGQSGNPITTEAFDSFDELVSHHLLLDVRLFDPTQQTVLYRYPVYGGRHLNGGPARRHWYIASGPVDGTPYLCSTVLATAEHLAAAAQAAAHPSLIRPGKQVALQVNAGSASERVTQMLTNRLIAHGLDKGDVVATLRVTATESPTGEEKPISNNPNAEKVQLQKYECFYDLVDVQEHVLYGSQIQSIALAAIPPMYLRKGETAVARVEELLARQVQAWANGIVVPGYLSADGHPAVRPETVLKVQMPPTPIPSR